MADSSNKPFLEISAGKRFRNGNEKRQKTAIFERRNFFWNGNSLRTVTKTMKEKNGSHLKTVKNGNKIETNFFRKIKTNSPKTRTII